MYRKYRRSTPTHVTPPPWIFMSETFGPSVCAMREHYHSPLPCIHPPGLFYCSSTEEGRALWWYMYMYNVYWSVHSFNSLHVHVHVFQGWKRRRCLAYQSLIRVKPPQAATLLLKTKNPPLASVILPNPITRPLAFLNGALHLLVKNPKTSHRVPPKRLPWQHAPREGLLKEVPKKKQFLKNCSKRRKEELSRFLSLPRILHPPSEVNQSPMLRLTQVCIIYS